MTYTLRFASRLIAVIRCRRFNRSNWRSNAEALGPDYYVIDRHGLQIWNQQRKLLRNEE